MANHELQPIDEFDLITAQIEIEYVTDKLGIHELIIRDYPYLNKSHTETKYSLLEDPTNYLAESIETQIMTERVFPAIAKIIYEE